jgi:UDP-N-acetylmuramoyl-tripeptide--D-alanyl-D-alanine ligase
MPGDKRGEILNFAAGFGVIDDSYNSNPTSLVSMARTLVEGGKHARRLIVVAGEMLELGATGPELHHAAGREIAAAGVQVVWGVRGLAQELVAGARAGGLSDSDARFFENTEAAAGAIGDLIKPGDLILVKGSRGVRTDLIVKQLREQFELLSGK